MKAFLFIVFSIALISCEGEEGPQGPKGDRGEPGKDGTEITSTQVLEKLREVDGPDSQIDADTLDGIQLKALTDRLDALETQVALLQTENQEQASKITDLEIVVEQLQSEMLYAFDGSGQKLGPVVSVQLDSIVYFDPVVGWPVEVFYEPLRGDPNTLQNNVMYFDSPNCTLDSQVFMRVDWVSRRLGFLDQATGRIWVPRENNEPASKLMDSSRKLTDVSAPCEGALSDHFVWYEVSRTIDSFTPGVTIGKQN